MHFSKLHLTSSQLFKTVLRVYPLFINYNFLLMQLFILFVHVFEKVFSSFRLMTVLFIKLFVRKLDHNKGGLTMIQAPGTKEKWTSCKKERHKENKYTYKLYWKKCKIGFLWDPLEIRVQGELLISLLGTINLMETKILICLLAVNTILFCLKLLI